MNQVHSLAEPDRQTGIEHVARGCRIHGLDARGRQVPRSELDYWMALSFTKLGQRDSASAYRAYVRRAWQNGDPEVQTLLANLH